MRITKYKTMLEENGYPELFREKSVNYGEWEYKNPESIVYMMNDVFRLDRQSEEYFYEICFSSKMKLIGVFEISHGTIDCTHASPREVFQKALICGASRIVLIHNHPSGYVEPSDCDYSLKDNMEKAGKLMGIPVVDNIIVGKSGIYFSFCKDACMG